MQQGRRARRRSARVRRKHCAPIQTGVRAGGAASRHERHPGDTEKIATPISAAKPSKCFSNPWPPRACRGGAPAVVRPPKPTGAKLGFKTNEHVVYPAHGVGQIVVIEEQEVAGFKLELFVISFVKDKMILKALTPKVVSVGMRKLAEPHVITWLLTLTGRARISG